jgi:hypothetical protein
MGCDIHFVVEEEFNDKWLGVYSSDYTAVGHKCVAKNRFYSFFAALAGVRADEGDNIRVPAGLPDDISDLSLRMVSYPDGERDTDLHSHSHMSLKEFCDIYRETKKHLGEETKISDYEIVGDFSEDARVIFCFDN